MGKDVSRHTLSYFLLHILASALDVDTALLCAVGVLLNALQVINTLLAVSRRAYLNKAQIGCGAVAMHHTRLSQGCGRRLVGCDVAAETVHQYLPSVGNTIDVVVLGEVLVYIVHTEHLAGECTNPAHPIKSVARLSDTRPGRACRNSV